MPIKVLKKITGVYWGIYGRRGTDHTRIVLEISPDLFIDGNITTEERLKHGLDNPNSIGKVFKFAIIKEVFNPAKTYRVDSVKKRPIPKITKKEEIDWTLLDDIISTEITDKEKIEMYNKIIVPKPGGISIVKRRGDYQRTLRKILLEKENRKCQLCNIDLEDLLITSHIKKDSQSSNEEKCDINNVLLLCILHDKLFENGYVSFDNDGKLIISKQILTNKNYEIFNLKIDSKINIDGKRKDFLVWHRINSFKE